MAIGPFRVGDKPQAALAIDLTREGSVNPTTGFTGAEIDVLDPDGVEISGFTAFFEGNDIVIDWPTGESVLTKPGMYTIQASLVGLENREAVSPTAFQVLPVTVEPKLWASVADVKAITGKDVSEDVIYRAQAQVEVTTGLIAAMSYLQGTVAPVEGAVAVSARDSHFLKMGVAYQAAWLDSQPDVYDRANITSIGQDGVSVQYADQGLILAPLSKKALNRLSWFGSRSIRTGSGPYSHASLVEYYDDRGPWVRMGV